MNKSMMILSLGAIAVVGACRGETRMEAGRWEMTYSITDATIPGAPPEMVEQLRAQKETKNSCLTEEEARAPLDKMMTKSSDESCTTRDMKMEGGRLSGSVTCQQPGGAGEMTADITGEYTKDTMKLDMEADVNSPALPGQKMEMTMRLEGRRVGACDGTEPKG